MKSYLRIIVFLFLTAWFSAGTAGAQGILVVDGRGGNPGAANPDDDNGVAGIQPAGRTSSGRTYRADTCLIRHTFKTLQSALHALDRQYLAAGEIRITAVQPLRADDPSVPSGVSSRIYIRHNLNIYSGRTVPAVIEGGTTAVTIRADNVILNHLEIRRAGFRGIDYAAPPGAVLSTSSLIQPRGLELIDIDVHDNGATGVYLAPGRNFLKIRKSRATSSQRPRIVRNRGNGIFISGLHGITYPGLILARADISDTDITHNGGHGLFAANEVTVSVQDSLVQHNGRVGISLVQHPRNVVIRSSRILDNDLGGVWIRDSIAGTGGHISERAQLIDNEIQFNHQFGIRLEQSWAWITQNKITRNHGNGIVAVRGSDVTIKQNCTISSNERTGIVVRDHSRFQMSDARVNNNRPVLPPGATATGGPYAHGIVAADANPSFITSSQIKNNADHGIIADHSTLTVNRATTIADHPTHSGISSRNQSVVNLDAVFISENKYHGVYSDHSTTHIRRSELVLNEENGIFVDQTSRLDAENSGFSLNKDRGIAIGNQSTAQISRLCRIFLNENGGVSVDHAGSPVRIADSHIRFNKALSPTGLGIGISITNQSNPVLYGNTITNNESRLSGGGIRIVNAQAVIGGMQPGRENQFLFNEAKDGIGGAVAVFTPTGDVVIENNFMLYNTSLSPNPSHGRGGAVGLYAAGTTTVHTVKLRKNVIHKNTAASAGGAISINNMKSEIGDGQAANGNDIQKNVAGRTQTLGLPVPMIVGGGIYIHNQSLSLPVKILNNKIKDNLGTGIHLRRGGHHKIRSNEITENRLGHGISITGNSENNEIGPDNQIIHNFGSGIAVGTGSLKNKITQNRITQNVKAGIDLYGNGNREIPAPIFHTLSASRVTGSVLPGARGSVEVFEDDDLEGKTYIGTAAVQGDGTFSLAGTFQDSGKKATITLTDNENNTSEFGHMVLNLTVRGVADARENQNPGKIIPFNDDDDGNPLGADYQNLVIDGAADRDDMAFLMISRLPNRLHGGHVYLSISSPMGCRLFGWGGQVPLLGPSAGIREFPVPDTDINNAGLALHMLAEGTKPGSHVVSLIYRDHNNKESGRDDVLLTVVRADLSMGMVNDALELDPGGLVCVNSDDDNRNSTIDLSDSTVTGENDLMPLTMKIEPATLAVGSVTLDAVQGAGNIKVWAAPNKTAQISLPATWPVAGLPNVLYVEGVQASSSARDTLLRLTYRYGSVSHEDRAAITVVEPDLDIAGVDDLQEGNKGGRIVLNNDDDNQDGTDDNRNTGTVNNENNLTQISLNLTPGLTAGTLELDAPAGRNNIRVWQSPSKGTPVPLPATWPAGSQPSVLYVEGFSTSASQGDIDLRLRYNNGAAFCDDPVKLTVFAIKSVTWVATATSPITPNTTQPGGGFRIFPGKLTPAATATQEAVNIQVTVTPPMPGIPVAIRSFDVDDPSAFRAPIDDESRPSDNRDSPVAGTFVPGGPPGSPLGFTNSAGRYTRLFYVGFRPGDNYKIAAGLDPALLRTAYPRQGGTAAVVYDSQNRSFPATGSPPSQTMISDLLTVWRHVHVNLYAMAAPTAAQNDVISGTIVSVTPLPGGISARVLLDRELPGVEDQYEGGMLRVGASDYTVIGHRDPVFSDEVVTILIRASQTSPAAGAAYTIWDDDLVPAAPAPRPPVAAVTPPVLSLLPNTAHIAPAFNAAYVDPVFIRNSIVIPFLKNVDSASDLRTGMIAFITNSNSTRYWEAHVASGFQSRTSTDQDPDSAGLLGWNIQNPEGGSGIVEGDTYNYENYTMIYQEVLRESGSNQSHVVAHELGHQFEGRHGDGGLMTVRGATFRSLKFTPQTLLRIRTIQKP